MFYPLLAQPVETPFLQFVVSSLLQQVEVVDDPGVTSVWLPGVLLVLAIFGIWALWRFARRRSARRDG